MQEAYKKFLSKFSRALMFLLVVCGLSASSQAATTSVSSSVSATANTGGNILNGSGEIKTGDAKAESSVKTEVNSSDEANIKIDARAEANGQKVEEKYESDEPNQSADIHKEAVDENASASVDVKIDTNNANADTGEENVEKAQKGIIASVKEKMISFIDKIISFFY
jgi:hypothetical protein